MLKTAIPFTKVKHLASDLSKLSCSLVVLNKSAAMDSKTQSNYTSLKGYISRQMFSNVTVNG